MSKLSFIKQEDGTDPNADATAPAHEETEWDRVRREFEERNA